MKTTFRILTVCFLAAWILVAGCGRSQPAPAKASNQQAQGAIAAIAKLGNLATDPFAQMSLTFDGNPPPELIKEKVDKVLEMYGAALTDPNRSQAGRTLVALRKEHGHSEMDILDKMLETPPNGAPIEQAAAAISSAMNQ